MIARRCDLENILYFTIRNACRSLREGIQNRREIFPDALQKLELNSHRFVIDFRPSKRLPERLGRPPGTLLGHSRELLGSSWAALGLLLAALGRSWGALGLQIFYIFFKNLKKTRILLS